MKLKPSILATLSWDDLKRIVDQFGLDDVDRRSWMGWERVVTGQDSIGGVLLAHPLDLPALETDGT